MAPSEFSNALTIVDERLRTVYTMAASLLSYAVLALAAVFAVHGITPVVGTSSVLAVLGGLGAMVVWYLRKALPESPRWLESVGRTEEADAILSEVEREASLDHVLPPPSAPAAAVPSVTSVRF